jgi:hypothetical protein
MVRNLREPGAKGGGRRSLSVGESCRSKPVAGVFRILPQVFLGSIFTRHGREDTTREGTACVGAVGKAPCLPYFSDFLCAWRGTHWLYGLHANKQAVGVQ